MSREGLQTLVCLLIICAVFWFFFGAWIFG